MLEVFFRAMEDLDERRGRPRKPREPATLERHLGHLLATDAHSCVVADDHGRVAAFGILMSREGDAFLSFLFVLPEWQGRGMGRAIVGECLRAAGGTVRLSTCAEADQLVSTALYASLGMAPREPIYLLRGELDAAALPTMPRGISVRGIDVEAVAVLDLELLGYRRPEDHRLWAGGERRGWMFERAAQGVVGYGYAHPSGRIGPLAASQPDLLPALLGHLVRSTPVLEGRQVVIAGAAIDLMVVLLGAGMRMDGTPAIYCADRPGPRLDRYLPMSFALL